MPVFIEPQSLDKLIKDRVYELLVDACVRIEERCGAYDNDSCKEQVNVLWSYFNRTGNSVDNLASIMAGGRKMPSLMDKRILISMLMHADASTYCNLYDGNVFNPTTDDGETRYLQYMEFFRHKLQFMTNVTKLDLSFIRDVHLLFEVIGKNCHKLEELKLVSSEDIKSEHNNLLHLVGCPKLHRVIDDEAHFQNYEKTSVRNFIKLKKNLTYFNVRGLGKIVSTEMEDVTSPLSLTCAYEVDSEPEHIRALAKHCNRLESLKMSNLNYSNPDDTIDTLSKCSFPLKHLELEEYSINKIVNGIIPRQGQHLSKLILHNRETNNGVTKREIKIIGKYCQHLTELDLFIGDKDDHQYNFDVVEEENVIDTENENRLFKNLQSLSLIEAIDFKDGIVSLCLENATRIQKISLRDFQSSEWSNTGGALICLENPMKQLDYLTIAGNSLRLSVYDVSALYDKFSCVKSIHVMAGYMDEDAKVRARDIHKLNRDNNYNIDFEVMTYEEFWERVLEEDGQEVEDAELADLCHI